MTNKVAILCFLPLASALKLPLAPIPIRVDSLRVTAASCLTSLALLNSPASFAESPPTQPPPPEVRRAEHDARRRVGGEVRATLVTPEESDSLKKEAEVLELKVPPGSDLERMLNGEGGEQQTVSSPRAHS